MTVKKRNSGFTLTEVLISAGILAVGFMLIAGAFPVGVKLTTQATERTIGATVAQEAVAKMRLFELSDTPETLLKNGMLFSEKCVDYETIAGPGFIPTPNTPMTTWSFPIQYSQFYPSTSTATLDELKDKKYHWSALCRWDPLNKQVQVTVFVSRLAGAGAKYPDPADLTNSIYVPKPIKINNVSAVDQIHLDISSLTKPYFREGSVIVNDRTGSLYTIVEKIDNGNTVVLSEKLDDPSGLYDIWLIPPAKSAGSSVMSGRWPCVWVLQEVVEFNGFASTLPTP